MKIAIDARMIQPGSMHGIARYVYHLLDCFRNIARHHHFFVLINENNPLGKISWPEHMQLVPVRAKWISFREQWEIPLQLKQIGADLFHAPSFVAPLACPSRLLMTIHDLNHLVLPQFYTPLHVFYYQIFVKRCIRRSRYVLTVSNFSKAEIVRNLGVEPEKVFVTYNGVSSAYRPISDPDQSRYIRDIYGLPEEFIFCLSNNKPHKNVHQLVRAWCFSDISLPLVLASMGDPAIIQLAESFGKKHLLYFTKFIAEEHLPTVYSMTRVFVYPSTYEGFGLPPLEALSCGVPVVVARSASLPEVVGEQAIFMDPYDYQSIAAALSQALEVSGRDQTELRQKRMNYARRFSWEDMARKTLAIYEQC
ncbi:MAG: glycosyltransferase family 4 protein [Deltaproteobacteria bacterium]|nr:glycosyltransferase family 4 protein [Deltaproteobacteria bacterium]